MLYLALFVTALNLILWVIFFFFYKNKFSANAVLKSIREEINAMLAEIRQETDMSATIIEGRIQTLKALIDEADSHTLLSRESEEQRRREQEAIDALSEQTPISLYRQPKPESVQGTLFDGHPVRADGAQMRPPPAYRLRRNKLNQKRASKHPCSNFPPRVFRPTSSPKGCLCPSPKYSSS
jgi:hypothetical protein